MENPLGIFDNEDLRIETDMLTLVQYDTEISGNIKSLKDLDYNIKSAKETNSGNNFLNIFKFSIRNNRTNLVKCYMKHFKITDEQLTWAKSQTKPGTEMYQLLSIYPIITKYYDFHHSDKIFEIKDFVYQKFISKFSPKQPVSTNKSQELIREESEGFIKLFWEKDDDTVVFAILKILEHLMDNNQFLFNDQMEYDDVIKKSKEMVNIYIQFLERYYRKFGVDTLVKTADPDQLEFYKEKIHEIKEQHYRKFGIDMSIIKTDMDPLEKLYQEKIKEMEEKYSPNFIGEMITFMLEKTSDIDYILSLIWSNYPENEKPNINTGAVIALMVAVFVVENNFFK